MLNLIRISRVGFKPVSLPLKILLAIRILSFSICNCSSKSSSSQSNRSSENIFPQLVVRELLGSCIRLMFRFRLGVLIEIFISMLHRVLLVLRVSTLVSSLTLTSSSLLCLFFVTLKFEIISPISRTRLILLN